jgi:signal transduction histidine kinase
VRLGDRLRQLSLPRRLGIALATVGVVGLAIFALFTSMSVQMQRDQDFVTKRIFDAVVASDTRFRAAIDEETGVRGYALGRTPELRRTFDEGRALRALSSERIDRLLAGYPDLLRESHAVDEAVVRWREGWADPTLADVAAGRSDTVDAASLARGKRLFDEIRSAHDRYSTALSQQRLDMVADLDRFGRILTALLGLSVALGLLGLALLALALRRWVTAPVAGLAEEARTVRQGQLEHSVRLDGPPEFQALAHDIELMRLGLVQQLHEVELARRQVEEARAELEAKAAELERSNRDLEQFAYVASHDLQEPLRKVASFCQMLQRRYSGQLDERADQYIEFAVDGAKRMQALINDLLAFSRVGRLSGASVEVDLQACFDQAVRNLELRIQETDAVVTSGPLPRVWGEPALLTMLLQNLVGNALKFAGPAPPRVHVAARRGGDEWELSCHDEGIGIQARFAERIFVIFQRLHARDEYEGTGIGLAMCKKIVEHHGGRIWLDTDVQSGTTFRWTLPVVDTEQPGTGDAVEDKRRDVRGEVSHV